MATTQTNADQWTRTAMIAGGAFIGYEIIKHRKLLLCGLICAATAVGVRKALSAGKGGGRPRRLRAMGSPSFPGESVMPSSQEPLDEVDEAMMESFPASDPPASYRRASCKDQVNCDPATAASI